MKDIEGEVFLVSLALMLGFGLSLISYETLFFGHCTLVIYIEEVLLGFSLLGFPG